MEPEFQKNSVTGLTRPVLAPLGWKLELSCQLSPPQHAQHMEIHWFRNHYTQPVHLCRNGKNLYGEIISKYVEWTELIKGAIGKGNVILRIFNVTLDDDGPYQCFFKDGECSEEHITDVKVTGSDIQIPMHPPNMKGVILKCHSEGWFPLPHMEWRDSRGQVIPETSKSYSQNGSKLFNMIRALLIETSSHQNVTCYLQNSLTHQEKSISIILSGAMGAIGALLVTHCVVSYLLPMVALSSEFTVTGLTTPVLVPFGGKLELSCQLSPPQNAQHMEIRWFRNRYTQPVHLYRNGKDLHGETISTYVERTELIKDAIGKGKVTLRIFNVTVDDDGPYHCFFKDGKSSEEHITEVKVIATGSEIQIFMHPPNIKGVMLECLSGGWFPPPHMEWRDSRGQVISATSKSHSQNGSKLFNMTMALFIETSSHRNVTCYLQNSLTHQDESITIVLSGELFLCESVWKQILVLIATVPVALLVAHCVQQRLILGTCSKKFNHWLKSLVVPGISMIAMIGVTLILNIKQRVPAADPNFELDTLWLEDITVILFVMIVFIIQLVSLISLFLIESNCKKFQMKNCVVKRSAYYGFLIGATGAFSDMNVGASHIIVRPSSYWTIIKTIRGY